MFKRQGAVNLIAVFRQILKLNAVSTGIVLRIRKPGKGSQRIDRVCKATQTVWAQAINRDHVPCVARPPVNAIGELLHPLLDTKKSLLHARAIVLDQKGSLVVRPWPPVRAPPLKRREQFTASSEIELVGLIVSGQAL